MEMLFGVKTVASRYQGTARPAIVLTDIVTLCQLYTTKNFPPEVCTLARRPGNRSACQIYFNLFGFRGALISAAMLSRGCAPINASVTFLAAGPLLLARRRRMSACGGSSRR